MKNLTVVSKNSPPQVLGQKAESKIESSQTKTESEPQPAKDDESDEENYSEVYS